MITLFKNLSARVSIAVAAASAYALPAFAQTQTSALKNPLNAQSLQDLISEILGYAVTIGTIFLTLMLVFVGFKFVSARGNPEAVAGARSALVWTVIGGLLLLGASALSAAISATVQAL